MDTETLIFFIRQKENGQQIPLLKLHRVSSIVKYYEVSAAQEINVR